MTTPPLTDEQREALEAEWIEDLRRARETAHRFIGTAEATLYDLDRHLPFLGAGPGNLDDPEFSTAAMVTAVNAVSQARIALAALSHLIPQADA